MSQVILIKQTGMQRTKSTKVTNDILLYSGIPVSHDSVRESQSAQYQDSKTSAAKKPSLISLVTPVLFLL